MNGFIEIYVDGWLRYRWLFTLRDYESFPWEQQVDLRRDDLVKIIDSLIENVVPNFNPDRTQFSIAYESKMNDNDYSEMPEPVTDGLHNEQLQAEDSKANSGGIAGGTLQSNTVLPVK